MSLRPVPDVKRASIKMFLRIMSRTKVAMYISLPKLQIDVHFAIKILNQAMLVGRSISSKKDVQVIPEEINEFYVIM